MLDSELVPCYRGVYPGPTNGKGKYFEGTSFPGIDGHQTTGDDQQGAAMHCLPPSGIAQYVMQMRDSNDGTFLSSVSCSPACGHDSTIRWTEPAGAEISMGMVSWALCDDDSITTPHPGDRTLEETQPSHTYTHGASEGTFALWAEKQNQAQLR
ncbi:hypothetical protein SCAR479_10936 [Seiridium cardinale]|uniref:Uncharacterized protein n=1 Tax=Seiridium cardinale TaxID=138064 RepID=A0ABR2XF23_9PEZI